MSSWRDTTLRELVRIEHGFAFKGVHFADSGEYVVLTPGNFHEAGGFRARPEKDRFYAAPFPERYLLKQGDLIVAMTEQGEGLLGSAARIPESIKCLHNQRLGLVLPKPTADQRFLFYLFNSDYVRQQIRNSSSGSKVRHTSPERMYRVAVRAPDRSAQRKIAAVLAAYDDLIEANRRRIALLERMAEEIYREWFVRLRFPGHAKTKITKGLPVGWRDGRFRDLCRLQRGYDLPDALIQDGPYPVIASTAIKAFHAEFKVEPPVITTGRSGSLGKVLLVNQRAWPLNTSLYVRDFHGNSPYLVFYTLRGMGLESFNSGAGVPTLNRNHLEGLRLAIPPPDLQTRFDECVGPIHRQGDILEKSNAALQRTRDLLLPRLISGKLSVESLDIAFPPSMAEK